MRTEDVLILSLYTKASLSSFLSFLVIPLPLIKQKEMEFEAEMGKGPFINRERGRERDWQNPLV